MKFEKIDISKVITADYNPRLDLIETDQEFKKIENSIKEFGYVDPIILNKDMTIIGGHQRVKVLQKLGFTLIDCVIIDIDKTKEKALNIALNKISGDWDNKKLFELLQDLKIENYNIDFTGFNDIDFEKMSKLFDEEIKEDNFDFENNMDNEYNIKYGDIFKLREHRLMCGDSTKSEDINKLCDGVYVDLLITDPPYNVNYTGDTKEKLTIKNDKMSNENFNKFLNNSFSNCKNVMKDGAVFYIWFGSSETYNFYDALINNDFKISQQLVWEKNSIRMGRHDYHYIHEPCVYGWKKGTHLWASDRKQRTVLNFDMPLKNDIHPTMKPVALFDYLIKNNTKSKDIVLDAFSGSGTTLIACEQNDRISYNMEFDEKYCNAIIKRWENLTNEKAVKING